jgi:ribosomal RNA small subunit methyltransferase RsmB
MNTREIALDMLAEVMEGDQYSHTVLNRTLRKYQQLGKPDRAFLSRLFTGTVKVYLTLDYVIDQFSSLPVAKMKPLIRNLLRISVYQLLYMDKVPVSAVCNEAVKLAKKRKFSQLSGFVNGVLRNIARNKTELSFPDKSKEPVYYLEVRYSVPNWFVNRLLEQYDFDTVEKMLEASLKEKEITIRCNQKKITPEQLKELLKQENVTAIESSLLKYAFKITDYDYLDGLNSFRQGYFTVQDVSSMLVCEAAGISENDFVVDVCAAPGGKALHAAEKAKYVSARDVTEYKINLMNENIRRMGFDNISTKVWDAVVPDPEIVELADILIADLPCSGMGVIGKKPDIKYKSTQNQHKELVELQRKILSTVQNYVKRGGVLIFSTCTVDQHENQDNYKWFLEHFEFRAESLDPYLPEALHNDMTKNGHLQLLNGIQGTDGFYLARFVRK